jgi:hypothetical protein
MTLLKCSPLSSRDGGESAHGTPDTKITAFSPEDIRSVKPTVGKSPGTLLGVGHHDPFVTTVPKQKTGKSPKNALHLVFATPRLLHFKSLWLLFEVTFPPRPCKVTSSAISSRFQTSSLPSDFHPTLSTSCLSKSNHLNNTIST